LLNTGWRARRNLKWINTAFFRLNALISVVFPDRDRSRSGVATADSDWSNEFISFNEAISTDIYAASWGASGYLKPTQFGFSRARPPMRLAPSYSSISGKTKAGPAIVINRYINYSNTAF